MAVKARALETGDLIGLVSPSWGGAAAFPHRLERGRRYLESLGFRTVLGRHAAGRREWVSGTPEERAADLHDLFGDPTVKAIIATIGGDHSCQLLPFLDFELIKKNPKVFMGSSDITVLNLAIHAKTGLCTFNGPAVMADLGEYPRVLTYTEEHMLRALTRAEPIGPIVPAAEWTDEFLDWGDRSDLTRPRRLRPSEGWAWLKGGRASGPLVGGCLESLEHLRGTPYWPCFEGAILFLETSELKPSPARVDAVLADYENMGVLGAIGGLLFARPHGYTEEERLALHEVIIERTRRYSFPVVADMDFGHTSPILTLPIGCRAILDADARSFAVTEAAVAN